MTNSFIKYKLMEYITHESFFQEKFTKIQRINMLKTVMIMNESQIKSMFPKFRYTADTHERVKEFIDEKLPYAIFLIPGGSITALTFLLFKRQFDKCRKVCTSRMFRVTEEDQYCEISCKYGATLTVLKKLKTEISECKNTKNPQKCKQKMLTQIKKWERRKSKLEKEMKQVGEQKKRALFKLKHKGN